MMDVWRVAVVRRLSYRTLALLLILACGSVLVLSSVLATVGISRCSVGYERHVIPLSPARDHSETIVPLPAGYYSSSFKVFFYNAQFPSLFPMLSYERSEIIVENFVGSLKERFVFTDNASEAKVFIAIVWPLNNNKVESERETILYSVEKAIHHLAHWNAGMNHFLIELAVQSTQFGILNAIDTENAVTVSSFSGADVLIPPLHPVLGLEHKDVHLTSLFNISAAEELMKSSASFSIERIMLNRTQTQTFAHSYQTQRRYLLYFEGKFSSGSSSNGPTLEKLMAFKKAVERFGKKSSIAADCTGQIANTAVPRAWSLCRSAQERISTSRESTFALIAPPGSTPVIKPQELTRLLEALMSGVVPVLLGRGALPFDDVIDWSKAAIIVPEYFDPDQLIALLSSIDARSVFEFQRHGNFLLKTYFNSFNQVLTSVVLIAQKKRGFPLHFMCDFQPSRAFPFNSQSNCSSRNSVNSFQSYKLQYDATVWNNPPGPHSIPPVSPFQFHSPSVFTDPVIIDGSGQKFTYSAISERFTVVTITYNRTNQLSEFLRRFENCPYLDKIVVVWNNEEPIPENMEIPEIGTPIEVVSVGRNSLNNRFLPLAAIATEAVLQVDDDISLSHSEIELAFRVWLEHRDAIVGWTDRIHAQQTVGGPWLYSYRPSCFYSMMITNSAFIHKYYHFLYTHWMPQAARELVDHFMNCEDIAMNFLVSYISRRPPIKVGTVRNHHACNPHCPEREGLSNTPAHLKERNICLNVLESLYGHTPLVSTGFAARALGESFDRGAVPAQAWCSATREGRSGSYDELKEKRSRGRGAH